MSDFPPTVADREKVRLLGEDIGYGRMMHFAEELWREMLARKKYPTGGEFSVGPCASMVVPCPHTVRDAHGHCDICCGSGRITKWVAENLAKITDCLSEIAE